MDKNIIITLACIVIFYLVYLKITEKTNKPSKKNVEDDSEIENEGFQNNIVTDSVDIYKLYKDKTKTVTSSKITKDNFDFDYETDFKFKDMPIIKEDFHSSGLVWKNNYLNMESQGSDSRLSEKESTIKMVGSPNGYDERSPNWINTTMTGDPNFLVPNDLESNGIYSMAFPENTSIELAQFNAENVTDLFKSNNMEDLYNNINADVYRGYKTMKYML